MRSILGVQVQPESAFKLIRIRKYHEFLETVPDFEQMLVRSGIKLLKYYLDISKDEQKIRLKDRLQNPLKQWKVSPIDKVAQKHWDDYSQARNTLFARTHRLTAP
jgi:polyphosphate kinase